MKKSIIVIGGGIVGVAAAYCIKKRYIRTVGVPVCHWWARIACFVAPSTRKNAVSKTLTRPERELEKSWLAINMFM